MSKISQTVKYTLLSGLFSLSALSNNYQLLSPLSIETESTQKISTADEEAFEGLEQLFNLAESTTVEEVKGNHSGRCFVKDFKNKKFFSANSALGAGYYLTEKNKGPLFPPKNVPYLVLSYLQYAPIDYFDYLKESEFQAYNEFIMKEAKKSKPPTQKNNSLYVKSEAGTQASHTYIRRNSDYIIGQVNFTADGESVMEANCYWFKPIEIKPKD